MLQSVWGGVTSKDINGYHNQLFTCYSNLLIHSINLANSPLVPPSTFDSSSIWFPFIIKPLKFFISTPVCPLFFSFLFLICPSPPLFLPSPPPSLSSSSFSLPLSLLSPSLFPFSSLPLSLLSPSLFPFSSLPLCLLSPFPLFPLAYLPPP